MTTTNNYGAHNGAGGNSGVTRRGFVMSAAALGGAAALGASPFAMPRARAATLASRATTLKVGVIGCGGRGTGAAVNALEASPDTRLHSVADLFGDRLEGFRNELTQLPPEMQARCPIDPENVFVGVDSYKKLLATDCDVVILATPPGFRPIHFAAAIDAGKHVFMEKPVAVCPAGVRMVLDAARKAKDKKLNVVCGTQRRHEVCYLEAMKRIEGGAIGKVTGASVYWNQGGLWMNKRRPEWSDVEWQLRNWLYFDWLSGDHIVEQHVHNLDVAAWAMSLNGGNPWPTKVSGMGGRQSRTSPDYGHVFDHFAVQYEYADGRMVHSYCRQVDGADGRVEEVILGTEGRAILSSGRAKIEGKNPWRWEGSQPNPYVTEHTDLIGGITGAAGGQYINEGERIAHSTMMAVAGRMSAYSGKDQVWDRVLKSSLDLRPSETLALGPMPTPPVAIPGKTGTHW